MTGAIGYYVHHQGQGHLDRALLLADALGERVTLLGTGLRGRTGRHRCVNLPDDRCDASFSGADGNAPGSTALHYAPVGHDGIAGRVALVGEWIARARPALFIVDVSVEIAMLARLASVPVLYVRLSGVRNDAPHLEAFRGARMLIAPFDARLDDAEVPDWVRAKSFYAPGLCARPVIAARDDRLIVVVLGRGRGSHDLQPLVAMAEALAGWRVRVLGDVVPHGVVPANLTLAGWVDTVAAEIGTASVVVGAGGDGLVNLVLSAAVPFVCIPEPRAYDEQGAKARALARENAAVVCDAWPVAARWPALIDAAIAQRRRVTHDLYDPDGVARAAALIAALTTGPAHRIEEQAA